MKDQEYDYFYEYEQDAKYCYPGTNVLKNKLDIRDLDTLHEAERDYSAMYILGRARRELLIFPKEPFSVWCNLSKASLMICIVN